MTGDEPATNKQRQFISDLGAQTIPDDLTRTEASTWIEELRRYTETSQRGTIQKERIRTDLFQGPPGRGPRPADIQAQVTTVGSDGKTVTTRTPLASEGTTSVTVGPTPITGGTTPTFQTAKEMADRSAQAPAPPPVRPPSPAAAEVYEEREEDRGPLTPVQVMTREERESYGLGETETVVVQGRKDKTGIVPEYGMPAKYLFARISRNARSGQFDVRVFPSIEGLTFRANAFAGGIRKLTFEFIRQEDVPGLAAFSSETNDPQIIARAHVVLGNGTEVVEEGTVRLSEIKLHQSRRTGKMVARSPVARDFPLEVAKKRALSRALRWGTGFGGTALDELPLSGQEALAPPAGGEPAALPGPRGKKGGAA